MLCRPQDGLTPRADTAEERRGMRACAVLGDPLDTPTVEFVYRIVDSPGGTSQGPLMEGNGLMQVTWLQGRVRVWSTKE
jgi:hypothetical protein